MISHKLFFFLGISISVILSCLFYSCSNGEKTEITQKGPLSLEEKGKTVTPLPAPQRLRLLPVDMENKTSSDTVSLSSVSPEKITPRKEEQQMPASATETDKKKPSAFPADGFGKLEIEWTTPENWYENTTKPMRVVSFNGGENSEWECYISVLLSQAGGIEANLKRWANQMGKKEIDAQDINQLPEVLMLGKQCKILDIAGDYTDMQGEIHKDYRLLGVICPLEEQTLFVKMTGPESDIALHKDNFIKLCNSIKLKNKQ